MFRKIVSNLSFSPALVGQLGFYAKRLRKEEATRRLGLIFVALALVVQTLAVFQPPESANASNPADFVPGGLGLGANRSLNNFLRPYDANTYHLKDVMNYVGLTREEIANAKFGYFITGTDKLSWGFIPRPSTTKVPVTDSAGNHVTDTYARPMYVANGKNAKIYGWIGQSEKLGWFAIMQACGNLVTTHIPPPPAPPEPAKIVQSKNATNVSQGNIGATTVTAKENDRINYTLTVENTGGTATQVEIVDHIDDILEYSTLVDNGGGTYDSDKKTLSWPAFNLGPGEKQTRVFGVRILASLPATPRGQSDPSSHNCLMENIFGNDVIIPVVCAPPKVVEEVVRELPHTGPAENMIFAGIVLSVVTYFFFRSRQLGTEVRLIRRDLNSGTI